MSDVAANILVALIVVASACYALWRLGPRRMREAIMSLLGKRAAPTSSCGACGDCDLVTGKNARARAADSRREREST